MHLQENPLEIYGETLYLSASTVDLPFPSNTSFLPRAGMPLVPGFSCPDGSNANRCGVPLSRALAEAPDAVI